MSDVKDILGVPRAAVHDILADKPEPKERKEKMKRPEGMSREAFALLSTGMTSIVPSQFGKDLKKKDLKGLKSKRVSSKGTLTYQWMSFPNTARSDDLQLFHWVKCYKDATGKITEAEPGEYPFAKYNKKLSIFRFDDEEWTHLLAPDADWSKEESQYLLDLCEQFDLRFVVIADRYSYNNNTRTVEELKGRYYSIARQLLIGREGGAEHLANNPLVKQPYNLAYEQERKKALAMLLSRTAKQEAEESAIIEEARRIEVKRKSEAVAKKTQTSASGSHKKEGQGTGHGGGPSSRAPPTPLPPPAATPPPALTFSTPNQTAPDGVPSLFGVDMKPFKPKEPGVYARGVHTKDTGAMQLEKCTGGPRTQKLVESTIADLGVPEVLRMPTRAVCGAWLSLRNEVIHYLELKRKLQNKQGVDLSASEFKAGPRKKGKFQRH